MNARLWKSLTIGLVLPAIGVLVIMPLLANTSIHVLGIPLLFMWIFLMFPLTTLCLWLAWRIDEPDYRDAGDARNTRDARDTSGQAAEHATEQRR